MAEIRTPFTPPLPGQKPVAPASAAPTSTPLPGTKPPLSTLGVPSDFAALLAPVPAEKPVVPGTLAAMVPLPTEKPGVPAGFTALLAPVPGEKPTVPVDAAASNDPGALIDAIRSVTELSGHSFQTMLAQATQESRLNLAANNSASSAAGPFQFLESTWLDMIRRHGDAYGLGALARQIKVGRSGVSFVANAAVRKQILDLRHDPNLSAGMAARYLAEGRAHLSRLLHRPATEIESRMAYVMGPGGAARLIRAASASPHESAADLLPSAAAANRSLFYGSDGKALTTRQVVANLTRRMQQDALHLASLAPAEPVEQNDAPGAGDGLAMSQGTDPLG